ncbi:MAG: serine O-acetyltransferase [Jatrophihabitans sp.]
MSQTKLREAVLSDLAPYSSNAAPGWRSVVTRCIASPGYFGCVLLRLQQALLSAGHKRIAAILRSVTYFVVGIDGCPQAPIGPGLFVPHPAGLVLGPGVVIGANVTLCQHVTLGALHLPDRGTPTFPIVEDGAFVGAGACALGDVRIGAYATVGANSVVVSDIPAGMTYVGVPAHPLREASGK